MARKTKSKKAFAHVQSVRRGKNGPVHHYHRIAKVRLPDEYGSPEFARAWAEAEDAARRAPKPSSATGSVADLISEFERSPEWLGLADRTRADYGKVRDWFLSYDAGPEPARKLTQADCEQIIDVALRETHHRFAVYMLQYGRRLYNWKNEKAARKKRFGDGNPWKDIRTPPKPRNLARRKQNRPWTPDEFVTVMDNASLGLSRVYALGLCGFDGSTMYPLEWSDYREGVISADRHKTGVAGDTVIFDFLRPLFDEAPRPSARICTNDTGNAFPSLNTLQTRSSEFLRGMARRGLVSPGLTLHGLRHTAGKALGEGGADLRAIQGLLRHKTERMALFYSREAEKSRAVARSLHIISDWHAKGTKRPD